MTCYTSSAASAGGARSGIEVIRKLRKWAFFVAAGVAVIGCGGGGSHHSSTGSSGGGTGTTDTRLAVNLNSSYGTIDFTYATGAGRRATGDLTAVLQRLSVSDQYGEVNTVLGEAGRNLEVSLYNLDSVPLDIPFKGQTYRLFENFTVAFQNYIIENSSGSLITYGAANQETINTRIRVLPGRSTCFPIFLDDAMFVADDSTTKVTLDRSEFLSRNSISSDSDVVASYFSDYVMFDLSNLAASARPKLSDGTTAEKLFISGDNYAIGASVGGENIFEVLTLNANEPIIGSFGLENSLPGGTSPGTYTLLQADPLDLTGLNRITSLKGGWRTYTKYFTESTFHTFEFILFPTSRLEASIDASDNGLRPDEDQEVLVIQRDKAGVGGKITGVYFGYADLDTKAFSIFPVKNLSTADGTGEIDGTLSSYLDKNDSTTTQYDRVRHGTFSFTGSVPSGWPTTGTFTVFRK